MPLKNEFKRYLNYFESNYFNWYQNHFGSDKLYGASGSTRKVLSVESPEVLINYDIQKSNSNFTIVFN